MRTARYAFVALLFVACTQSDDTPSVSRSPREQPPSPSSSPSSGGPLSFVLRPVYEKGTSIQVKLRNDGDVGFEYNPDYEACFMTYLDEGGREFLVPEGTHCDLISVAVVEPGDTATLFRWDLDECTKDEWGCQRDKPLPPGSYTIKGRFRPEGGGDKVRVQATFEITPRQPT